MKHMSRLHIVALAIFAGFLICSSSQASVIFDDFNANAGHFTGIAPNSSGTTNFDSTSTAARTTLDSFEGGGSMRLDLLHTTASTNRVRFLSGAGGAVSNNVSFTLNSASTATDGFIGYYYKVVGTLANATGTTMSINLNDSTGAVAGRDGGTPKPINADGAWHLVEWNLDSSSDWGVITGIGGGGHGVLNGAIPSNQFISSRTLPPRVRRFQF